MGLNGAQRVSLGDGEHRAPAIGVHSITRPSPLALASLDAVAQTLISAGACRACFGAGEEREEKGKGKAAESGLQSPQNGGGARIEEVDTSGDSRPVSRAARVDDAPEED